MPFDVISGAEADKSCPDKTCRGHAPRKISLELRVRCWTRRTGTGPVTVAREQRLPIVVPEPDRVCEFCGAANTIDRMQTGPDQRLRWPTPSTPPQAAVPDEQIPGPAPQPTLEARVEALEQARS